MSIGRRVGVNCALSTPFSQNQSIDTSLMLEHGRWVLQNGADGLTLFGTTGEGPSIGTSERQRVIEAFAGGGFDMRGQVIVSVTACTIEDAVSHARAAYAANCRAILITPPFYFPNMSEDGLFDFFSQVFEKLGADLRDVLLYHIPAMTKSVITPGLVARLREAFGDAILGLKDSGGDWEATQAFLDHHRDIQVLVGSERHCAQAVRAGGSGTICGLANVRPDILRKAAWDGEEEPLIVSYRNAVLPDPFVVALKALVARRTGVADWRLMRRPMEEFDAGRLQALLERIAAVEQELVHG